MEKYHHPAFVEFEMFYTQPPGWYCSKSVMLITSFSEIKT